jgi:hypothetical protein
VVPEDTWTVVREYLLLPERARTWRLNVDAHRTSQEDQQWAYDQRTIAVHRQQGFKAWHMYSKQTLRELSLPERVQMAGCLAWQDLGREIQRLRQEPASIAVLRRWAEMLPEIGDVMRVELRWGSEGFLHEAARVLRARRRTAAR